MTYECLISRCVTKLRYHNQMERKEFTLQSSPKVLEHLVSCKSTLLPVDDHDLLLSMPSLSKQYSADLGRVN